jgi:fumarate reductase subunit D
MIAGHRNHPLWFAFALHRASGLLLALFLPVHFLVLGLAIDGAEGLDGFLVLTDNRLVKLAEFGLVFLLAVHMFGGLRVLALEFLAWSPRQKTYAAASLAGGFFIACGFLLSAGS